VQLFFRYSYGVNPVVPVQIEQPTFCPLAEVRLANLQFVDALSNSKEGAR
jgi:hypothetical protein